MSCLGEFPDYDGEFYCPKGWEDSSYHNDTCPHILKRLETETQEIEAMVWQDYVNEGKRECGGKRYQFQITANGYDVFYFQTDDWGEIETLMEGVEI